MEVSEDADIEQLLALRNALMNQLNHTQATSSTSKQHSRSRRSSINKSCPAVQPSALSPTTFPPPPPSHHPKKRSKKRKISAQCKDDTASSSELKSNSDNSRPASNNINRQSPNQQTKPIENQCSKSNDADEISIDAEHIVNKQSEQSKTFPESKHNQAHDQPPASAQCPFLHSNSIPISFVKNDTINGTLNEDNCDNTVNDTDMTKTGFTNDRKRVHCDDDDDDDDDNDDGNAIKNGKIRETESLLVDTSGGASTECVNAGTKELPEQPISSPKEHGNEKTPANEEHQGAAVEVHHAEDEDGLLPPPPPPPEINFSANENIKNEIGVSHDIIPPPPKPPGQNDMVDGVESPSTSYLQSTPQNNDEQNAEEDNEESVKETTFEEREVTDDECEENIDSLLEKPFADGDKPGKIPIPEEGQMREKIVLAHRGVDYFDVLPEGWVELTHTSGLPVYLHKSSRVCTFSRPYFIGPSSVRHHHVPESAIPCLHQRRVLRDLDESAKLSADALQNALNMNSDMNESDNKNKSNDNLLNEEKAKLIATLQAPNTKVQTAEDFKAKQLEPKALHEYAKRVFKFKTIQVYRFQKWSATRTFHRQKKLAEAERLGKLAPSIEVPIGRPTLPGNVQLITVPAMEANLKPQHKGFFLNPQGKTSISILHEYVQKVLKSTINYQFTETRSSSTPYGCAARLKMNLNNRVMSAASIKEKLMLLQEKQRREANLKQQNGDSLDSEFVILGNGCGNSKKSAKLDAARSALKVLIPAIDFDADGIAISHKKEGEEAENEQEDAIALFDMLSIEDSRIPDLSLRAGQPSPYLLLQECLKRNAAYGDTEIKLSSERVRHQKHQFDMDVGKHRVSVECSNKREGKQKASQAMLKKLHPNLDTWGSLIRLYGNEAQQKQQEAKRSQRSIIKLQGNRDKEGSSMEPNQAILERLRAGMLNIENDKKRRKSNVTNEKEALIIRPKLSQTNALLNADEAVQESSEYAATHPDALSAFRIDL